MSDVLNAEDAREMLRELRLVDTDDMESARRLDIEAALARSHEQLRGELDEARKVGERLALEECGKKHEAIDRAERAEAAVRAGGCAADLAEALRGLKDAWPTHLEPTEAHKRAYSAAHNALKAYDAAHKALEHTEMVS